MGPHLASGAARGVGGRRRAERMLMWRRHSLKQDVELFSAPSISECDTQPELNVTEEPAQISLYISNRWPRLKDGSSSHLKRFVSNIFQISPMKWDMNRRDGGEEVIM